MIFWSIGLIISLILILLGVGFVTLFERKILGLSQLRVGPSKTVLKGLLQPLLDGGKLFQKSSAIPLNLGWGGVPLAAMFMFISMGAMWSVLPKESTSWVPFLLLLVISSISLFGVSGGGWSGRSKYAFLGGVRSIVQGVSYEAIFSLTLFFPIWMSLNLSFALKGGSWLLLSLLPLWGFLILMETNRPPFDFPEAESELISGFNVEFGSLFFSLIFMGEYGMILFMSWLSSFIFSCGGLLVPMSVVGGFMAARAVLPRIRLDKMLFFCWQSALPFLSVFFFILIFLKSS